MKKIKEIRFIGNVVELANEVAELEEKKFGVTIRVHESAERLLMRAARSKIARLKRK